jgi:GxxExxY protein
MNTDCSKLVYKAETEKIIGCAMSVMNELGHGFHEKPYENALVIEFLDSGISVEQQKSFDIVYKDRRVGTYIPDLIAFGRIVIDTKVVDKITNTEVGQMMNYLSITGLQVGFIINFKNPRLDWKRIIR